MWKCTLTAFVITILLYQPRFYNKNKIGYHVYVLISFSIHEVQGLPDEWKHFKTTENSSRIMQIYF